MESLDGISIGGYSILKYNKLFPYTYLHCYKAKDKKLYLYGSGHPYINLISSCTQYMVGTAGDEIIPT